MNSHERQQYMNEIKNKKLKRKKMMKRRRITFFTICIMSAIFIIKISTPKKSNTTVILPQSTYQSSADILDESTEILMSNTTKDDQEELTNPLCDNIDTTDLKSSSGSLIIDKLIDLSSDYPDVETLLQDIDNYPDEILEMVIKYPETIDYAIDYPQYYPDMGEASDISVADEYLQGNIPLFIQWDKRWGYYNYGETPMALNGCGPTALSMVIIGLTGDIDQNPKAVADFSYEKGYLVEGQGSSWTLMSEGSTFFGIEGKELPLSETVIRSALRKNQPIIASMGPGDFTTGGHYIVLTGMTDKGKIIVNDPNSKIKSNMKWDMDVFMNQTKNLWTFYKS